MRFAQHTICSSSLQHLLSSIFNLRKGHSVLSFRFCTTVCNAHLTNIVPRRYTCTNTHSLLSAKRQIHSSHRFLHHNLSSKPTSSIVCSCCYDHSYYRLLLSSFSSSPPLSTVTRSSLTISQRHLHTPAMSMEAFKEEGERKLMDKLRSLDIELPTIEHEPKRTVEEANKELARFGVSCEGTKNMFLKSKKNELILVTALHTTPTDMKTIQKLANTKDLRFAPAEVMSETLKVEPGSVTPFAFINTDRRDVLILLDKNMMDRTDPFVLHPCRNDRSCLVLPAQLTKFLDHMGCNYKVVSFDDASSSSSSSSAPKAAAKSQRSKEEEEQEEDSGNTAVKHSDPNKQNAQTTKEKQQLEQMTNINAARKNPASCKDESEAKTREVFKQLGIDVQIISHKPQPNPEEEAEEGKRFGVPVVNTKNMFLKSKKNEYIMVTALRKTNIDMRTVQALTNMKDVRFVPVDAMEEIFCVELGAVVPFNVVNTPRRDILFLIDKKFVDDGVPGMFAPNRNDKTSLIYPEYLIKFLEHMGCNYKIVSFDEASAIATSPTDTSAKKKNNNNNNNNNNIGATATNTTKQIKSKQTNVQKSPAPSTSLSSTAVGETKLGIMVKKEENFSAWYTEVIVKAEMIEYYDVSGCYIIRPWAFFIWRTIQRFFGDRIAKMGVEDCYFPMFVSRNCLEREKDHIEGFAPEVAWVTRAGSSELENPVAIRPTSETVMYPYYAKWIRSHRDLPVRLNMWNNVIRWEFSHPMPFIRTREFLWQEGHCAWANDTDCAAEVLEILDNYASVYEELLAVPVIKGRKTEKEKFAGAAYTTTVETFIEAVGRGCQGGTSHNLGQNFGKMFNITFQDPEKTDGSTLVPFQNSWGLSTRVIGVMIMVHGDNQGMVMPPRVASVQVVIIPVGITKDTSEEDKQKLIDSCNALERQLKQNDIRAKTDLRLNYSPGWRFNAWEVKGVPIRVELGPKELQSQELTLALRYNGTRVKIAWDEQLVGNLNKLMDDIHDAMIAKARASRDAHLVHVTEWNKFVPALNDKCIILAPWCGSETCEDNVKKDSNEESKAALAAASMGEEEQEEGKEDVRAPSMGAKTLCIPFDQPSPVDGLKCICKSCDKPAFKWVLFGRSY